MLKVLMIDHFLPDSSYTLELGKKLKRFCDLTIFCRKNVKKEEPGIDWITEFYAGGKGSIRAVIEYICSLFRLISVIKKGKFDVVHIQTFKKIELELPIYLFLRRYYAKLFLTVHNILPHEVSPKQKRVYERLYQNCDVLIVHNETSKKQLLELFSIEEKKIYVIPHGSYDIKKNNTRKNSCEEKRTFLLFGLFRRYKGIDILLRAVSLIPAEQRKEMKFVISGKQFKKLDGTDYRSLLMEYGVEDCVELREGYVEENELAELFSQADFVLFPYRHIYGSGALLMAYTFYKPVIVSDIPAFVEETNGGATGLIFESEDPEALAKTILRAAKLDREAISRYCSNISRLVREKYNWNISAKKLADIYVTSVAKNGNK